MRAPRPKGIICEEAKGTSLSISRLLNGLDAQMYLSQGFIYLRIGLG